MTDTNDLVKRLRTQVGFQDLPFIQEEAADRIEELEAKLAKAIEIAALFSGGVEYDYHGNIVGEEERKALAELEELIGGKND